MRVLAGIGALALTFGLAAATPAVAQVYIDDDFDRSELLTHAELIREVENQGYDDVGNLRISGFGGNWQATAEDEDGELVTLMIDPFTGRVIAEDEI
jgi:hypothetical protein